MSLFWNEFLVAILRILEYTKIYPEVCDNPFILNLHLLLWDSYIGTEDVRPSLRSGRQKRYLRLPT